MQRPAIFSALAAAAFSAALLSAPRPARGQAFASLGDGRDMTEATAVWRRAGELLRRSDRVSHDEPFLYYDAQFAAYQRWTLKYQKYGTDPATAGDFRRIFIGAPGATTPEQIARAYGFYGSAASAMLDELFPNVAVHVAMTPESMRGPIVKKIERALTTLLPDDNGNLSDFKPADCDYVAQPINALWFAVNAMRLLDDYGRALYGIDWIKRREEVRAGKLRQGARIKDFDEFRVLDRGLPVTN